MTPDELQTAFAEVPVPISFSKRPDQVPGDLRIAWRLAALVTVLRRCRGGTANLEQIHLLTWSLRSAESQIQIQRWFRTGRQNPEEIAIRYDPTLTRTIAIATAAGLIQRKTNLTIALTTNGRSLADTIWSNKAVLTQEKQYLSQLPSNISQKTIRELIEWR